MEVLYFKFIGQISCNSHEYYTCNTSISIGQKGGVCASVDFNSSQTQLWKKSRSGTTDTSSSLLTKRWVKELQEGVVGALTDASAGTAMPRLCSCCLPIERGAGSQKAGKLPRLCQSAQFQPISTTLKRSMQTSLPTAIHSCRGNDLLTFVWFLHPSLIEIHTASLAWLSCPLDPGWCSAETKVSSTVAAKKMPTSLSNLSGRD